MRTISSKYGKWKSRKLMHTAEKGDRDSYFTKNEFVKECSSSLSDSFVKIKQVYQGYTCHQSVICSRTTPLAVEAKQ